MPRNIRPISVQGKIAVITLTKGYVATIDAVDVPLVEGRSWHAIVCRNSVYAATWASHGPDKQRTALMHRALLAALDGIEVDHIDGNGLDNRRANLRLATHAENLRNTRTRADNTSGVKGVRWRACRQKWQARITLRGEEHHLGLFIDIAEAAAAYAAASAELHGEFGRLR